MFKRMLASAVIAGAGAGLLAALLHFAWVQPDILLGEQFETGALTHFTSGSSAGEGVAGHTHDHAEATDGHAHAHDHAAPAGEMQRNGLTVLFMVLVYVSYGMILTAGFGLAEAFGLRIGAKDGLLWGIGGFVAFQMAPAIGLAPELPGTIAADLGLRQVWWWSTVVATGAGLVLLGYGGRVWTAGLGLGLIAAPHVIGAPALDSFHGTAPPELAAAFAAQVLGAGLVVWAALGWLSGRLWSRGGAVG